MPTFQEQLIEVVPSQETSRAIGSTDTATLPVTTAVIQSQEYNINANGISKTKKNGSHGAMRKEVESTPSATATSTKVAPPSQPLLYAEINVPSKKAPLHRQANNLLTGRRAASHTKLIPGSDDSDDMDDDASQAHTTLSSLTGRDSLFYQAAADQGRCNTGGVGRGAAGMGRSTLMQIWCTDKGVADAVGHEVGESVTENAAELENYFDYSNHTEVSHDHYLDHPTEEDGIVGKLLGALNDAFSSTCQCFDGGVNGATVGGKSVTSGGMGATVMETVMETVNDTTATIANTMNNMSNKSPPKTREGSTYSKAKQATDSPQLNNKDQPIFSKPMEIS